MGVNEEEIEIAAETEEDAIPAIDTHVIVILEIAFETLETSMIDILHTAFHLLTSSTAHRFSVMIDIWIWEQNC